jgi:hypothetical protein
MPKPTTTTTTTRTLAALAFAVGVLSPAVAFACPVCFSGNEANRNAYFLTFLLMTALPLAMMGGLFWYLRKRSRELGTTDGDFNR